MSSTFYVSGKHSYAGSTKSFYLPVVDQPIDSSYIVRSVSPTGVEFWNYEGVSRVSSPEPEPDSPPEKRKFGETEEDGQLPENPQGKRLKSSHFETQATTEALVVEKTGKETGTEEKEKEETLAAAVAKKNLRAKKKRKEMPCPRWSDYSPV